MNRPAPDQVGRERTAFILGVLAGIVLGALSCLTGASFGLLAG